MATSGIHHSTKIYLITGDPGVGKTTLIKKLSERIKSEGIRRRVKGFYTKELRDESHSRIGFDVIDINDENNRAPLARLSSTSNSSWPKVGKYSVDLRSFESVALPNITNLEKDEIVIVDEIGKMESFSSNFNRAIGDLMKHIESANSSILLATVPSRNLPISDKIKSHHLSKLFTVTFQNRNKIEDEILKYL